MVHQLAAIDEGNDLDPRRQDLFVQLLDLCVETHQRSFRIGALAHGHPRRHHVVVIDNLAVLPANRARELPETDLGALRHHGDILHAKRCAALRRQDRAFDIVYIRGKPYFPNVDLLQSGLDEAASRVDVVIDQLLLHLPETQPVSDQLIRIDPNLIFARRTSERGDVHDIRDSL